eukprot:COSAG04_NODE_1493_length_6537_cov_2.653619_2_plen_225_part_00
MFVRITRKASAVSRGVWGQRGPAASAPVPRQWKRHWPLPSNRCGPRPPSGWGEEGTQRSPTSTEGVQLFALAGCEMQYWADGVSLAPQVDGSVRSRSGWRRAAAAHSASTPWRHSPRKWGCQWRNLKGWGGWGGRMGGGGGGGGGPCPQGGGGGGGGVSRQGATHDGDGGGVEEPALGEPAVLLEERDLLRRQPRPVGPLHVVLLRVDALRPQRGLGGGVDHGG